MRFMVDESAGRAVVEFLRNAAHDVLAVSETMRRTDDSTILAKAVDEGRVLITNDKDFGGLVYRSGRPHAGILLLRLRDEHAANRVAVMRAVLEQYGDQLERNFTVATEDVIRVRHSGELS